MAPIVIADLFFFDLRQPADLAISLLLGALRLAFREGPSIDGLSATFLRGIVSSRSGFTETTRGGREFQFQLILRIMCRRPDCALTSYEVMESPKALVLQLSLP
jgi:hypothetical protein